MVEAEQSLRRKDRDLIDATTKLQLFARDFPAAFRVPVGADTHQTSAVSIKAAETTETNFTTTAWCQTGLRLASTS